MGASEDQSSSARSSARSATVSALLERVVVGARTSVLDEIRAIAERDGAEQAITLLAEVQEAVGVGWHTGHLTVADEHAASAIVDDAISVVAATIPPAEDGRPAIIACTEDEWHVIPARMLCERLRWRGRRSLLLGAAVPPDDLADFAHRREAVAVVLTGALSIHLTGAARSIAACQARGIPVVVGGRVFADAPRWSDAIGADALATDIDDLVDLLATWERRPPPRRDPVVRPPHRSAELADALVECGHSLLLERMLPSAVAVEATRRQLRDDIRQVLAAVDAAILVGDVELLERFVDWLHALRSATVLPDVIIQAVESLRDALESVGSDAELEHIELLTTMGQRLRA